MKRVSVIGTLVFVLLITLFSALPACGKEEWLKQLEKALKSQVQKTLFEQFIRYDKSKNMVSFSPALMELVFEKAKMSFGNRFQGFDLKPEGNSLNFSFASKSVAHISASVEPEALELSPEEVAIVVRLPHGLEINGLGLPNSVLEVLKVPGIFKTFSAGGSTYRLKCPLKDSALGQAISSVMTNSAEGTSSPTRYRLALSMENGWVNVNLGDENPKKAFLQFTMENLIKLLREK